MARKASSTISQEELYPHSDEAARAELDDARLLDLDVEEESPFLRAQKRISVRRASLPKKTATYLAWAVVAALMLFCGSVAVAAAYRYGEHSWRFRIESSDDIEITGLGNVTRLQVIEVMGGDIGRNVFYVPLAQRKKQLQQIPWVESASVMRFVPNRLKIEIHERTPVAFARIGSRVSLIDGSGVLMELPVMGKKKFSFPVVLGMNHGEPQSMRVDRMKIYDQLVSDLDSGGAHYSQSLSEVDLSDSDDIKVLADDPRGEVLVHLGSSDFLERFKIYVSHVQEWRRQFARLDSVDLRYEHQIVVNPDLQGTAKQPPLSVSAVRAAMAAGVKPAALVSREPVKTPPSPAAANSVAAKTPAKAVSAKKRVAKSRRRKALAKKTPVAAKAGISPASITTKLPAGQPPAVQKTTSSGPAAASGPTKLSKPSPAIPKGQQQ
jgi:cell division protein FtsQ